MFDRPKSVGFKKIDGMTFEVYKKKQEVILRARVLPKHGTSEDILKNLKNVR